MSTCFRIFNENYIDEDILANIIVSSEDTNFPSSNAFNQQRRSKVWRTAGYFNIIDTNRKLIFRESTGVDLTANIIVDEYQSISALGTAIKEAMELVGGSTYTITHSDLKFNIASNGVGGTGILEIYLSGSTIAPQIGMTADKTGALTYVMDDIKIHEEEFIVFDMGVATNPDAFIFVGQRNESIQITKSAVIKIQGNETSNFSIPSFTETLVYDDEAIIKLTTTGIGDEVYRYWRLSIVDDRNPNGYVEIGAFFLGNYIDPDRGRVNFPLQQSYIDRSTTLFSEGGQSFADEREPSQQFSVTTAGLQKEDIEEFDTFFNDFKTTKPFFVSMDSGAVWSSVANRRVILCKFDSRPNYALVSPDNFRMQYVLREEL